MDDFDIIVGAIVNIVLSLIVLSFAVFGGVVFYLIWTSPGVDLEHKMHMEVSYISNKVDEIYKTNEKELNSDSNLSGDEFSDSLVDGVKLKTIQNLDKAVQMQEEELSSESNNYSLPNLDDKQEAKLQRVLGDFNYQLESNYLIIQFDSLEYNSLLERNLINDMNNELSQLHLIKETAIELGFCCIEFCQVDETGESNESIGFYLPIIN